MKVCPKRFFLSCRTYIQTLLEHTPLSKEVINVIIIHPIVVFFLLKNCIFELDQKSVTMKKESTKEYDEVPVLDADCKHVTAVTVVSEPLQCQYRHRLIKLAIVATFIGVGVAIFCCNKIHGHMSAMRGSANKNIYTDVDYYEDDEMKYDLHHDHDHGWHHHGKGPHHDHHGDVDGDEWGKLHAFIPPPPLPDGPEGPDGPSPMEEENHKKHHHGPHHGHKHGRDHPPRPHPPSESASSSASSSSDSPDPEFDEMDDF